MATDCITNVSLSRRCSVHGGCIVSADRTFSSVQRHTFSHISSIVSTTIPLPPWGDSSIRLHSEARNGVSLGSALSCSARFQAVCLSCETMQFSRRAFGPYTFAHGRTLYHGCTSMYKKHVRKKLTVHLKKKTNLHCYFIFIILGSLKAKCRELWTKLLTA